MCGDLIPQECYCGKKLTETDRLKYTDLCQECWKCEKQHDQEEEEKREKWISEHEDTTQRTE